MDAFFTPPVDEVPLHLKPFVLEQLYDQYTAVDHAVWRYVIRQNWRQLSQTAHEGYLRHFFETGMTMDRIPDLREMNKRLVPCGWRAVCVNGFIPPAAFMDFQAYGLLPIAQDIRTVEHIGYTPAPDIIHEAAGHAPLILDPEFGAFLKYIGQLGAKAISSRADHEVYEAIRELSIVKEDPRATAEQIQQAEDRLTRAVADNTEVSEAAQLARIYWWTVEYGLIGSLETPKIFGAGLCSSMSEGQDCLDPNVRKVPFSLDVIRQSYDITKPQPQLFVVESFQQLYDVTEQFARNMACNVGGTVSLERARESERVCTAVYETGLQLSGILGRLIKDERGEAVLMVFESPSALAMNEQELPGLGLFSGPRALVGVLGRLERSASEGPLLPGSRVHLSFNTGVQVEGILQFEEHRNGARLLVSLSDARVFYRDSLVLAAEQLVLPIGERIVSVFNGSADKSRFVVERLPSELLNVRAPQTELARELDRLYLEVRDIREQVPESSELIARVQKVVEALDARHSEAWLVRLELLELLIQRNLLSEVRTQLVVQLEALKALSSEHDRLIRKGLELAWLEAAA